VRDTQECVSEAISVYANKGDCRGQAEKSIQPSLAMTTIAICHCERDAQECVTHRSA